MSLSPSRRAGPETVGPVTITRIGTTPEHRVSSRAARPHPSSAATPSLMLAPLEANRISSGRRSWYAWRAPAAIVCPSEGDNAPARSSPWASTSTIRRSWKSMLRARTNPAALALMSTAVEARPGEVVMVLRLGGPGCRDPGRSWHLGLVGGHDPG